jgi:hypothetical protein
LLKRRGYLSCQSTLVRGEFRYGRTRCSTPHDARESDSCCRTSLPACGLGRRPWRPRAPPRGVPGSHHIHIFRTSILYGLRTQTIREPAYSHLSGLSCSCTRRSWEHVTAQTGVRRRSHSWDSTRRWRARRLATPQTQKRTNESTATSHAHHSPHTPNTHHTNHRRQPNEHATANGSGPTHPRD